MHCILSPSIQLLNLECTVRRLLQTGKHVSDLRTRVLHDIRSLIDQPKPCTDEWFRSLPSHIQEAYRQRIGALFKDRFSCNCSEVVGIPTSILLGTLPRTPGWQIRADERYDHYIDMATFEALNFQHVPQRLDKPRVDPEWQTLLSEIIHEVNQQRMQGPFSEPPNWPRRTVAV